MSHYIILMALHYGQLGAGDVTRRGLVSDGACKKVTEGKKRSYRSIGSERRKLSTWIKSESAALWELSLHAYLRQSSSAVGGGFPQLTSQWDGERSNPYLLALIAFQRWHAEPGCKQISIWAFWPVHTSSIVSRQSCNVVYLILKYWLVNSPLIQIIFSCGGAKKN